MGEIRLKKLSAPFKDKVADDKGLLSGSWQSFVDFLVELLGSLGQERSDEITNNQGSAKDIVGLSFAKESVSCGFVDFYVQRTTSTNNSVSAASAVIYYNPKTDVWAFVSAPTIAGVTFSITSTGQVQYTSTDVTGTILISKVTWRVRMLAAKHSSYSQMRR